MRRLLPVLALAPAACQTPPAAPLKLDITLLCRPGQMQDGSFAMGCQGEAEPAAPAK